METDTEVLFYISLTELLYFIERFRHHGFCHHELKWRSIDKKWLLFLSQFILMKCFGVKTTNTIDIRYSFTHKHLLGQRSAIVFVQMRSFIFLVIISCQNSLIQQRMGRLYVSVGQYMISMATGYMESDRWLMYSFYESKRV